MSSLKSCAIYCRVSTDAQREKSTIDSQRTLLPQLAEKHGLAVYREYVDDGISGESIEARPAFQRLLDDSSTGKFQAVLVIDFDRLTRASDLTQLALIKKIFRDNNITVITPGQVFDFHDHEQDFLSDLFGILAKHEKRKILARTQRGRDEKKRQGKWIMGRVPLPYYREVKGGPLLIDPEKKALVLSILEDAKRMGRTLISRKYALGQGTLVKMLSRFRLLFYSGHYEIDGKLVKGPWEPIISLDETDTLLAHTEARKDRRDFTRASYLLTGMGVFECGECGRAVGSHTDSERRTPRGGGKARLYRRVYYKCNNRQCKLRAKVKKAEEIDGHVMRRLTYHLGRLDAIAGFIRESEAARGAGERLTAIDSRIKEEDARRKNLVRAISHGVIRLDEAEEAMKEVRARLDALAEERQILISTATSLTPEQLKALSSVSLYELDLQEARSAIKACVEKLVAFRSNLWIYYRFPLDEKGKNGERIMLD